MTSGRSRTLIPVGRRDLGAWPRPDNEVARTDPKYISRRLAVEMYANGSSEQEIFAATQTRMKEVRRLVRRCLSPSTDGNIIGFYALLYSWRTKEYNRTAPVNRVIGHGSGGCSGALTQLFDRYPEVEEHVQNLYLKLPRGGAMHEARVSYTELHSEFKEKLLSLGFNENDWPFSTKNVGYNTLREYCKNVLARDGERWIGARSGREAARRSSVGNGIQSILPNLRGYGAVQLDFHKVDAASIILIENPFGVEIEVPIARWHFGMMVEEKWGLVIGIFIALELNPSGDSVLELIESALLPIELKPDDPRCAYVVDGKILPNQLFPEFAHQCFSVLKMDNAKSNAAVEVVNNIMDTVGCAVNFGPVKAWWRRDLVERVFGQLTRRGLQRLPSTYGSGPADQRRSESPNAQAVRFRIMLTDLVAIIYGCVREHNEKRGDALLKASPIEAMRAAYRHPASGFFPVPLPKEACDDLRLLSHIEEVTVRGNVKKNVRPYVAIGRWRYTNQILASSYYLIGQKLIVYCDRRAAQIVRATVKETGEDIGLLKPPRRWANVTLSFRDRALINANGQAARLREGGLSTVRQWINDKVDEISRKKKSRKGKAAKEALAVAKIASALKKAEQLDDVDIEREILDAGREKPQEAPGRAHESLSQESSPLRAAHRNEPRSDPFGLDNLPDMSAFDTGE